MENKSIVYEKSKKFALRIVNLYRFLSEKKRERVLSNQLLRSGTSIGANLSEAACAVSKPDFLNKHFIAFKECSETLYWLDLLHEAGYLTDTEFNSIMPDAREIFALLSSITKTIRSQKTKKVAVSKRSTTHPPS